MRRTWYDRLNTPWIPAMIAGCFYGVFLALLLLQRGGDPTTLIVAGDTFVQSDQTPAPVKVFEQSAGYDGQFYYRLAVAPFTIVTTEYGVTFDKPAYRQQRILYPLLAWLLAGGSAAGVPSALIAVNFIGTVLLGALGGSYLRASSGHALWGVVFALYAGFLCTITRNLGEIVAVCCLLAALVCKQRRQDWAAVLCITGAVLAKETTLIAAVCLLLWDWKEHLAQRGRRWLYLVPLLVWGVWQSYLRLTWGTFAGSQGSGNIGPPLAGITSFMQRIVQDAGHFEMVWFIELVLFLAFMLAVLRADETTSAPLYVRWAWLFYCLLLVSLTESVWVEDWAFLRAGSELYLLGVIVVFQSKMWGKGWVMLGQILCWFALATDMLVMR